MIYTKEEQKEHRQEWVTALRSGSYEQGTGSLKQENKQGDTFCCLGVACDISGLYDWNGIWYDGKEGELPESVMQYYGMNRADGCYAKPEKGKVITDSLAFRNDHGYTFYNIAYMIENAPAGLLVE